MMFPDKKKAALAILAVKPKGPPMPDDKAEGDDSGEGDMGLESAASDVMDAMKADDAKGMATALKAFFEQCDAAPHEEGGE